MAGTPDSGAYTFGFSLTGVGLRQQSKRRSSWRPDTSLPFDKQGADPEDLVIGLHLVLNFLLGLQNLQLVHRFMQVKFAYGGLILSSSHFSLLPHCIKKKWSKSTQKLSSLLP